MDSDDALAIIAALEARLDKITRDYCYLTEQHHLRIERAEWNLSQLRLRIEGEQPDRNAFVARIKAIQKEMGLLDD